MLNLSARTPVFQKDTVSRSAADSVQRVVMGQECDVSRNSLLDSYLKTPKQSHGMGKV